MWISSEWADVLRLVDAPIIEGNLRWDNNMVIPNPNGIVPLTWVGDLWV